MDMSMSGVFNYAILYGMVKYYVIYLLNVYEYLNSDRSNRIIIVFYISWYIFFIHI